MNATGLVHALNDAVEGLQKAGKMRDGAKFTSHGMRAYYATARRSEFAPDALIAAEMGDKTGAAIVLANYGALPPNWRDSKEGKITWLPGDGLPAWQVVLDRLAKEQGDNIVALSEAA